MYGYEELASYTSRDLWFNDCLLGLRFYETKNTDKVILAHETRIKELEDKLQHLRECRWEQIKALSFDHIDHSRRLHKIIRHVRQRYGSLLSKFLEMKTCLKVKTERIKDLEECCKWCGNDSRIAGLHKRIAELESQLPKWISVKDRLPTKGQHVLVAKTCRSLYPIDVVCWSEDYITHDIVAHWMPLPYAPTTEGI